jgi:hypothetical protein
MEIKNKQILKISIKYLYEDYMTRNSSFLKREKYTYKIFKFFYTYLKFSITIS